MWMLAQTAPTQTAPAQGSNDLLILWGILLLSVALILFFVEVFVPSGGIIAIAGAVSMAAGIVMLFKVDTRLGLLGALVTLIAIPFLVGFGLKIWPDLPWIRSLILSDPEDDEAQPPPAESEGLPIGAHGRALTDLHPVGTCLLEGRRQECLSTTGLIRSGQMVRVVSVEGMQVKVAPVGGA